MDLILILTLQMRKINFWHWVSLSMGMALGNLSGMNTETVRSSNLIGLLRLEQFLIFRGGVIT